MKTVPRRNGAALAVAAVLACLAATLIIAHQAGSGNGAGDWPVFGHDPGGMRYSPLAQINRENASQLKVAWVFHTGDISDGTLDRKRSGFESTPIVVDGALFLTTGFNRVIALDPETGSQRWAYDPFVDQTGDYGDGLINRGVSTWLDPERAAGKPCRGGSSKPPSMPVWSRWTRLPALPARILARAGR